MVGKVGIIVIVVMISGWAREVNGFSSQPSQPFFKSSSTRQGNPGKIQHWPSSSVLSNPSVLPWPSSSLSLITLCSTPHEEDYSDLTLNENQIATLQFIGTGSAAIIFLLLLPTLFSKLFPLIAAGLIALIAYNTVVSDKDMSRRVIYTTATEYIPSELEATRSIDSALNAALNIAKTENIIANMKQLQSTLDAEIVDEDSVALIDHILEIDSGIWEPEIKPALLNWVYNRNKAKQMLVELGQVIDECLLDYNDIGERINSMKQEVLLQRREIQEEQKNLRNITKEYKPILMPNFKGIKAVKRPKFSKIF